MSIARNKYIFSFFMASLFFSESSLGMDEKNNNKILSKYTGPSLIDTGEFAPREFDNNGTRIKLTDLAQRVGAIGLSSKNEYESLEEESNIISPNEQPPSQDVIIVNNSNTLLPFFEGNVAMATLPKDKVDRFEHRRWGENLSRYYNPVNSPGGGIGSPYLDLESYTSQQLAMSLYIGAKNCNNHIDSSGHSYVNTSQCCTSYTRGLRQELIDIAARASRHSRGHAAYVEDFNKFDNQFTILSNSHARLVNTYPNRFIQQNYPVKPINNYVPFDFRNWVSTLASNNNTTEILGLTDLDDPRMMADKIYVTCRHSPCGGSTAHQYTSWNQCSANHAKGIRVEIFEVAKNLVVNQRYHDNYVRDALQFEISAKNIMDSYWKDFHVWNWNSSPNFLVGNNILQTPIYSLSNSKINNNIYQGNKEQFKSLTGAKRVLKSAVECIDLAKEINSTALELCNEVDSCHQLINNNRYKIDMFGNFNTETINSLNNKIEKLYQGRKNDEEKILNLKSEKKELKKKIENSNMQKTINEMTLEFEKKMEFSRVKWQEEEKKRQIEKEITEKKRVSKFLGKMLWILNMKKNGSDLNQFKDISLEDMIDNAENMIFEHEEIKKIENKK